MCGSQLFAEAETHSGELTARSVGPGERTYPEVGAPFPEDRERGGWVEGGISSIDSSLVLLCRIPSRSERS